jgi:hypothetical protein
VPIGDAIFVAISKVKRALGDASAQLGLRKWPSQKPVIFNTISAYLEKPKLSPILK